MRPIPGKCRIAPAAAIITPCCSDEHGLLSDYSTFPLECGAKNFQYWDSHHRISFLGRYTT
ncbi:hypothetical protein ACFPFV_03740 [Salinicoccus siamensis]|uniref:hypothetical protein n=1 Tax=Salinicoccus siamensis TaxID=381830 RepID=UPI003609C894